MTALLIASPQPLTDEQQRLCDLVMELMVQRCVPRSDGTPTRTVHIGHLLSSRGICAAARAVMTAGYASSEQGAILGALERLVEEHQITRGFGGAYRVSQRGAA